jgi:hypothetical protein
VGPFAAFVSVASYRELTMEWLREENRGLTRISFLSGVALLISVVATIVSRFVTDNHLADLFMLAALLFAFITGGAQATERATNSACVRINRLEARVTTLEKAEGD